MKPYTYLLINLGCIIVPFAFSFYKKCAFYREWRHFIPANIIVAVLFLVWDFWFTKIGVWGFNPDYLTGVYIFNLPLEEVLFFICIPYACVFTYFCFKWFFPGFNNAWFQNVMVSLLIGVSAICVICFHDKYYTFFTALMLLLMMLYVVFRKIDIGLILLAYITIIPFFFLSNGILTGSFIEEPIVWYNSDENIGIRMFTIPVEDVFYGFLLILGNVLIYEKLKGLGELKKSLIN